MTLVSNAFFLSGREAPGKAFRLYTEDTFWSLQPATLPEIQKVRLTAVVLQLKALGVEDPLGFDFMDQPPMSSLLRSGLPIGLQDAAMYCASSRRSTRTEAGYSGVILFLAAK